MEYECELCNGRCDDLQQLLMGGTVYVVCDDCAWLAEMDEDE
jgi:ribosome-binding protein aMBF1 (putative translation factor)